MKIEDAIRKAIKAYFKGLTPEQLTTASNKKMKYNKDYFDKIGEEFGIEPYEVKQ